MICFYRITEDENFYEATIEQMSFEGSVGLMYNSDVNPFRDHKYYVTEVVATGRFESFKDMTLWANSHGCTKALMRE